MLWKEWRNKCAGVLVEGETSLRPHLLTSHFLRSININVKRNPVREHVSHMKVGECYFEEKTNVNILPQTRGHSEGRVTVRTKMD